MSYVPIRGEHVVVTTCDEAIPGIFDGFRREGSSIALICATFDMNVPVANIVSIQPYDGDPILLPPED